MIGGTVWIIERDHQPYTVHGNVMAFPSGPQGTQEMKIFLNQLQIRSSHYWDAVLYESKERQIVQEREPDRGPQ